MCNESDRTTVIQGWVDRLSAGDPAARQELLACARHRLLHLAHKMLRRFPVVAQNEQTDDVLQSALIRLDHALGSVTPTTAAEFFGLAATQIRRELMDLARRYSGPAWNRVWGGDMTAVSDAVDLQDSSDLPRQVARMAAWSEFHHLINEMPEPERQLFDLLWYQELSRAEAARILGVSERTVYRRWMAARDQLCQALGDNLPA